jgi:hypothetical protein
VVDIYLKFHTCHDAGLFENGYEKIFCYDLKLGLLINFNIPLIKNRMHRIVNNL